MRHREYPIQPFAAPDAFDPVFANMSVGAPQLHRDPAIAVAPILAGRVTNPRRHAVSVGSAARRVAGSPVGVSTAH